MDKECRFSYSGIDDSLIVSCREENEKVVNSFMFDDFIFHLTRRGKIVGIQIRNASRILAESNVDANILNELKSVQLIIAKKENCLYIGLSIISDNCRANIPLRVLMPQTSLAV